MSQDNLSGSKNKPAGWWRPVLFISVVIVLLVLVRVFGVAERMGDLRDWLKELGPWGPLVFVLLYIIAVVAAIPGSALTVAAGALFGSVVGTVLVSAGSTVGAALAFLVARYFAREATEKWLYQNEKFQRLDRLTEEHGSIIVALTRLVPIFPFNLLNYGFGLTKVSFKTYVLWSWICMLPATILYVVGADALTVGLSEGKMPWVLIGVVGIVVVIMTFLIRYARQKLSDKEELKRTKS